MSHFKNRRSFLKVIGGATALSPFVSPEKIISKWPKYTGKKLGIALVGLGNYAKNRIGVALEENDYWKVTGLVTGSPDKIPAWKERFDVKDQNIYSYKDFDKIAKNKDIDAVYILLPNGLHAEYTIRAAKAGKHVICEKPMSNTVEEAEAMIKACDEAGVKLAIGYRLHFEPFNMKVQEWARTETYGKVEYINCNFAFRIGDPTQWRLNQKLAGGGPLMDIGLYCIQAARFIAGEEPIKVTAQYGPVTDLERFSQVEQSIAWQMIFPSNATMTGWCSYKTSVQQLHVSCAKGYFQLEPAYAYGPLKGKSSDGPMDEPVVHHQTAQMDGMGPLFLMDAPLPDHISGVEGLKDMKVLTAIYKAAKTGKSIAI